MLAVVSTVGRKLSAKQFCIFDKLSALQISLLSEDATDVLSIIRGGAANRAILK